MSKKKPSQASPISVASPPRIYVLKITLAEVDPPVWRRLEIEEDSPIDFAATAIRGAFGWSDEHGSEFTIKRRRYGDCNGWVRFDPEQEYERGWREIMKRKLSREQELIELDKFSEAIRTLAASSGEEEEDVIPSLAELVQRPRTKFTFLFDFGDSWEHHVVLERIVPAAAGNHYPRCSDGAGADPIEDCGGAWRLTQMIQLAMNSPKSPLLREMQHVIPLDWKPERFSVEETNRRLAGRFPKPYPCD